MEVVNPTKKRPGDDVAPEAQPEMKKARTEGAGKEEQHIPASTATDKNVLTMLQQHRPSYPVSDQFLLYLARMKPEDLPLREKTIVTVQRTDTLSSVMKLLAEHKILSAPVLTQVGSYYGFVDVLDIVRFITDLVGETMMTKFEFDIEKLDEFKTATVQHLMKYPISKRNPFHPATVDQSLLSIVEILATGIHRVPVLNEKHEIKHIVTQSSVIKFISEHLDMIGAKRNMKIHETETGVQYVVSVLHNERAIDAFKMMKICNVSGVAVVDDNGMLVGVVSGRDIKRISSTAFWVGKLFKPVSEFVHNAALITVRPEDTLGTAIAKCAEHNVHRVIVVNDAREPIGVMALTDILRELLRKN